MKSYSWDNANIVESYPGVCTPLTFSFARSVYRGVYSQLMDIFGADNKLRKKLQRHYDAFLGYLGGRFYYNLETWCLLVSYLPGFNRNQAMLQEMMGVKPSDRLHITAPSIPLRQKVIAVPLALWYHFRLARLTHIWIRDFERDFPAFIRRVGNTADADSLMKTYFDIEQRFLYEWRIPILNDIAVMLYTGSLRKLVMRRGYMDIDPEWLSDIGGGGNLRMIVLLRELTVTIAKSRELEAILALTDVTEAWKRLEAHPQTQRACATLMDEFGMRNGNDLKLETPNFRECPGEFIPTIRQYMQHAWSDSEPRQRTTAPSGIVINWLLRQSRRALNQREEMRLKRSKIFGLIREVFVRIGSDLHRQHVLGAADDIFFLEVEECFQLLRGTSTIIDVSPLVAQRRNEYKTAQSLVMSPHLSTVGIPQRQSMKAEKVGRATNIELVGRPNYPVGVEGEAVVMIEPDFKIDVRGKILVCRQTDPSWTPILGLIGGLVVERGSILSHAAIFSRELRIPSVIGVENATSQLRTGQRVRLEGKSGKVIAV